MYPTASDGLLPPAELVRFGVPTFTHSVPTVSIA